VCSARAAHQADAVALDGSDGVMVMAHRGFYVGVVAGRLDLHHVKQTHVEFGRVGW